MEIELTENRVNQAIRNLMSYLTLYVIVGILGALYNNYFFIGNTLMSAVLELYPILLFLMFAYLFILLILKVMYSFILNGSQR